LGRRVVSFQGSPSAGEDATNSHMATGCNSSLSREDRAAAAAAPEEPQSGKKRSFRLFNLGLDTPQSCASYISRLMLSPRTPDPNRFDLKFVSTDAAAVFFDFDGTLTATPGDQARKQCQKSAELCERAAMLAPRLRAMKDAGLTLGIISKSTVFTIESALQDSGLKEFFQGPIVGKAVGLEGKAGFIKEMVSSGALRHLRRGAESSATASDANSAPGGPQSSDEDLAVAEEMKRVLLVDDDVRELDRAIGMGILSFPAPEQGGLQETDFEELFHQLGLTHASESPAATSPSSILLHMPASTKAAGRGGA